METGNISIYDNFGKTIDRITIVFNDTKRKTIDGYVMYDCLGANWDGSCYFEHGTAMKGRHLGKKIGFSDLSAELQSILKSYFDEYE